MKIPIINYKVTFTNEMVRLRKVMLQSVNLKLSKRNGRRHYRRNTLYVRMTKESQSFEYIDAMKKTGKKVLNMKSFYGQGVVQNCGAIIFKAEYEERESGI